MNTVMEDAMKEALAPELTVIGDKTEKIHPKGFYSEEWMRELFPKHSVPEMSKIMDVSVVTLRNKIGQLQKKGLLPRKRNVLVKKTKKKKIQVPKENREQEREIGLLGTLLQQKDVDRAISTKHKEMLIEILYAVFAPQIIKKEK